MPLKTETIIDYLKQVIYKLGKIEQEVEQIKQTIEANSSNAFECELANEKLKRLQDEQRTKAYKEWFEKNTKKTSTTNTEVE